MDNTKHTPTPWFRLRSHPTMLKDSCEQIILDCYSADKREPEQEENAALIVRAVNAYEPMREALKGADQLIEAIQGIGAIKTTAISGTSGIRAAIPEHQARIRAALALAEKD